MADKNYPSGSGITAVEAAGLDANDFVFIGCSIAGAAQKTQYSELAAAFGGSRRNLLINANPAVNQRVYTSGTNTTTGNQYTLDRWRVITSGQNLAFADSAGKRTMTAPADGVEQVVEGLWLQSGTYVISWEGTAGCTVGGTARTNGEAFSLTGGSNIAVAFGDGTVANPQLEIGEVPTPFDWRPFEMELCRCFRFYQKSYAYATSPGTATGTGEIRRLTRASNTTTLAYISIEFQGGAMRAAPTITAYASDGTANKWLLNGATLGTVTVASISEKNFLINSSDYSGLTAERPYTFHGHYVADAEITT